MKVNIDQYEIENLERLLMLFKEDWDQQLSEKAYKWRIYFFSIFIITVIISINFPSFWWLSVATIFYFAVSLFNMLRKNADIYQKVREYQKQLELVQLLNKFQKSSCGK